MYTNLFRIMLCLFIGNAQAQEFSFQATGLTGFGNSKSFKEYAAIYNDVNGSELDKKLTYNPVSYGYNLQVNFHLNHLYSAIGYSNCFNSAHASFQNGAQRLFTLNNRYYNILIGFYTESVTSSLSISTGFMVKDALLIGSIRYPSGDRDYTYGAAGGVKQTQGAGVPILIQYGKNISDHFMIVGKAQLQVLSATQFDLWNYDPNDFEQAILDDSKLFLVELGLEYKL